MKCSTPGFPVPQSLLELAQTHVHLVSDAIQQSHLLSSPSPAFNVPQNQGLFQWAVLCIWWPKYWSFNFSISLSNEYSGLNSFRTDCFDILAVGWNSQESSPTPQLKSINSSALSFLHSPTLTSIHDIAWTRQTFVGKGMSLLFNILSRLVITLLPRSKRLLISWLQSQSAVILEPKK